MTQRTISNKQYISNKQSATNSHVTIPQTLFQQSSYRMTQCQSRLLVRSSYSVLRSHSTIMFPLANNSFFFLFYGVHYIKLDAKFWVRTKKWDSPKAVCTRCLLALDSLAWREVSATLLNGSLINLVDRFSGSTSFPRLTPTRICSEWSCGFGEFFSGVLFLLWF